MKEEKPPLFKTWRAWYYVVLGAMLIQVLFYFLITKAFA
jgi:hypothetical protein